MPLSSIFNNLKQNKLNKKCLQAAYNGDFKSALEFLEQGAEINYAGNVKIYAMIHSYKVPGTLGHAALRNANFKALTALLHKGLDVNISADGTPLVMYAIELKNEEAALTLLAHGADTSFVRKDLETPLTLAEANRMTQVVQQIKAGSVGSATPAAPVETTADVAAMKPLAIKKSTLAL